MGQVVLNLLSNAIKYGDGKPIEVSTKVENDYYYIGITDQGMGISEDKYAKIFECFERVQDDHENTEVPGLGLGLYIVKQIVERHGGKISVSSQLGKGTTFQVAIKSDMTLH